jgi:hypothetical protein
MARTPGFVQSGEPRRFPVRVTDLHRQSKVSIPLARLDDLAEQPGLLLNEPQMRDRDFNYIEKVELDSDNEFVLPQFLRKELAVVIFSGKIHLTTQSRQGSLRVDMRVGDVIFVALEHLRLPTRSVVESCGGLAGFLITGLDPSRLC